MTFRNQVTEGRGQAGGRDHADEIEEEFELRGGAIRFVVPGRGCEA
jgi:hypothetical protein